MTVVSSNPDSMTAFRDRLCGLCEDFERLHAQGIHLKAQEQYERLTGEITACMCTSFNLGDLGHSFSVCRAIQQLCARKVQEMVTGRNPFS